MSDALGSKAKEDARNKKLELIRKAEIAELKDLLGLPGFRRFAHRLLARCKTQHSIWEPSAKIHYNAGMQDLGHWFSAEIEAADQEAVFIMWREEKQRIEKEGE